MKNRLELFQKDFFDLWIETGELDGKELKAYSSDFNSRASSSFVVSYNGEKNEGEIGPIKYLFLDHEGLRARSWQAYLESEIAQTVLNKYALWVIGGGLKLQSNPVKAVLKSEKIEPTNEEFNEVVESRFSVFANSKSSDYSGMRTLHMQAKRAFLNAIIGGDVLVVLRYINNSIKVQLVDGTHVVSPLITSEFNTQAAANGNKICNGIEMNSTGEHIAYYVQTGFLKYERIEAKGKKSGLTMAFMVYGLEYRLDNNRGIPLISTVLETMKKLERYKEATVGSAEERQKIAFSIEHDVNSTGENPFLKNISQSFNVDQSKDVQDINGTVLANNVAATTNKQAINMPAGAKLNMLESKNELYFKDFYSVNIDLVCSCISIPPEVAMSKYDSNFSASRAALKDWEHTINVKRGEFSFQFYQNIYNFFLHIQVLQNKVQAPGYLLAFAKGNDMLIEAYRNSRFIGSSVPHIDPLKEAKAEREKLGPLGAHLPLTTLEAAVEALNSGDSDTNMEQFSEELDYAKGLGVEPPAPVVPGVVAPPKKKVSEGE